MDSQGWMRLSVAISAAWLVFCLLRFAIYSSFYAGTPGGDLFITVLNIALIVGLVLMVVVFGRTFFARTVARSRRSTHCQQCYARIPDGEEFCPRCGNRRER